MEPVRDDDQPLLLLRFAELWLTQLAVELFDRPEVGLDVPLQDQEALVHRRIPHSL